MYQDLHVSKSTKIANLNWNSKSEKLSSVNKHVFITVEIFLLCKSKKLKFIKQVFGISLTTCVICYCIASQ